MMSTTQCQVSTMHGVSNQSREQKKSIPRSLHLASSFSFRFGVFVGFFAQLFFRNLLNLDKLGTMRLFFLLIIHLLDSLILKIWKPQSPNPFIPLTTQISSHKKKQILNFFPDEMLESENSSMAERLYDLERQVLEQQEEILSLKSTLSEVLRRLNNLDCNSSRISSSTSSSSSYETTIKNNRSE